jgi:hypothetical protein
MYRGLALIAAAALLPLSACTPAPSPEALARAEVELVEEPPWRSVAAPDDVGRVDRVALAWEEALEQARRAGFVRAVEREGALLEPGSALPMPAPTPGPYLCRLIRIAPPVPRGAVLTAYRPFFCYVGVDRDALSIIKQTGTQRPSGYLWIDREPLRLIFLGSMAEDPRDPMLPYGADRQRDMAAVFERINDFRFRLVVPWPRSGAILDVYELVPNVVTNGN